MSQPSIETFTEARDALVYGDLPIKTKAVVIGASQTIVRGRLLGLRNQIVSLAQAGAGSGNVTLTLLGKTTGNIAHNASASTVKTAIVTALADLLVTDADIIATGGALGSAAVVLQFTGKLRGVTVDITVNDVSLDAGAVTATDTSAGGEGQYLASLPTATDGTQIPVAIAAEAVTTGGSATARSTAFEAGHFNESALNIGTHNLNVARNILKDEGIYLSAAAVTGL